MKKMLITLMCLGIVVAYASQAVQEANLVRPALDDQTLKQIDLQRSKAATYQAPANYPNIAPDMARQVIFSEDFEGVTPPALPTGWKASEDVPDGTIWETGTTSDLHTYTPPNYGNYYAYFSDDDAYIGAPAGRDILTGPAVNIAGETAVFLHYGYGFDHISSEYGSVEIRFHDGGSWGSWTEVARYQYVDVNGIDTIPFSGYLPKDSVQVRFIYDDWYGGWYWAFGIDNVIIEKPPAHDVGCTAVWSPAEEHIDPGIHPLVGRIQNFGQNAETFYVFAEVYDTVGMVLLKKDSLKLTSFPVGGDQNVSVALYDFPDDTYFYTKIYTALGTDLVPGNDMSSVYSRTAIGLGDIILELDAEAPTGDIRLVGIEFDGTYFYLSGSGDYYYNSYIHVVDTLGAFVCSPNSPPWTMYGWGYMDMCWEFAEGDSLCASAYTLNAGTVEEVTVDTEYPGSVTYWGAFYGPYYSNLALAYDPNEDVFFAGYWGNDVYKWKKDWSLFEVNTNIDGWAMIGAAYDTDYDEGGWVWWHSQDGPDPNNLNQVEQFDPELMTFTGVNFNYAPALQTPAYACMAGGMCFYEGFRGYDVLFTLVQGDPDQIVGLFVRHHVPVADATIDFYPNTLNLGSGGTFVKCYIELEEGFDVEDIDVASVRIEKIDGNWIDPVFSAGPSTIGDYDSDGIPDLMVKFYRADLIDAMDGVVIPPAYAELYVRGDCADADFGGAGMLRVINPQTKHDGAAGAELPVAFALYETSPNPFSRHAVIRYALPIDARVKLNIYDVNGRIVKGLVNNVMAPGYYNIRWDGQDDLGRKVSSGVYFVKFETENYKETRKLLLVR